MRKLALLSLLGIGLLSLGSCKKEEEAAPTRKSLLTAGTGTWKLTASTISPGINVGGTTITDFYGQMDACEKDDLFIFTSASANNYKEEEGATKCDPADPQIAATGNWTMSSDEKKLSITSTETGETVSETEEVTISSMTSTQMVGTFTEEIDGINYTLTATWTKQ